MKLITKLLTTLVVTATILACDTPTELEKIDQPDKSGSHSYDTSGNTLNGTGYFAAKGDGIVVSTGTGQVVVKLEDGYVHWDESTCTLKQQTGSYWHIATTDGTVTINGSGETLLQGKGTVEYSGEGFEFHYKD
jgi:hypothetical protein